MWALEAFRIFLLNMSLSACILCLFLNPFFFNFKPISSWPPCLFGIMSPTETFKKYESQLHGMVSLECLSILGLSLENYSFPFSHIHEVPCTWSPSTHYSRSFIPTKPIFSHYHISVSHCPQLHSTPNPINPLFSSPSPLA